MEFSDDVEATPSNRKQPNKDSIKKPPPTHSFWSRLHFSWLDLLFWSEWSEQARKKDIFGKGYIPVTAMAKPVYNYLKLKLALPCFGVDTEQVPLFDTRSSAAFSAFTYFTGRSQPQTDRNSLKNQETLLKTLYKKILKDRKYWSTKGTSRDSVNKNNIRFHWVLMKTYWANYLRMGLVSVLDACLVGTIILIMVDFCEKYENKFTFDNHFKSWSKCLLYLSCLMGVTLIRTYVSTLSKFYRQKNSVKVEGAIKLLILDKLYKLRVSELSSRESVDKLIDLLNTDSVALAKGAEELANIIHLGIQLGVTIGLGLVLSKGYYVFYLIFSGAILLIFGLLTILSLVWLKRTLITNSFKEKRMLSFEEFFPLIKFFKVNVYEMVAFEKAMTKRNKELNKQSIEGIFYGMIIVISRSFPLALAVTLLIFIISTLPYRMEIPPLVMMLKIFLDLLEGMKDFHRSIEGFFTFIKYTEKIKIFFKGYEVNSKHINPQGSIPGVQINGHFIWQSQVDFLKNTRDSLTPAPPVPGEPSFIWSNTSEGFSPLPSSERFQTTDIIALTKESKEIRRTRSSDYICLGTDIEEFKLVIRDFEALPGQLTFLIGEKGSGVSSLLHTILGETTYDEESSASLRNSDSSSLGSFSAVTYQGKISLLSSDPWILNTTIRENIILDKPFDNGKLLYALKYSQMEEDVLNLKDGLNFKIDEKAHSLTLSQKARLAFARTLYQDPDIWLFDNFFDNIEKHFSAYLIEETIRKLLVRKTVILASSSLDYVDPKDAVYYMERGTIVSRGRVFDIIKSQEFLSTYNIQDVESFNAQFRNRTSIARDSFQSEDLKHASGFSMNSGNRTPKPTSIQRRGMPSLEVSIPHSNVEVEGSVSGVEPELSTYDFLESLASIGKDKSNSRAELGASNKPESPPDSPTGNLEFTMTSKKKIPPADSQAGPDLSEPRSPSLGGLAFAPSGPNKQKKESDLSEPRSPSLGGLNFAVGTSQKQKNEEPSEPRSPSLGGLNFGVTQKKSNGVKADENPAEPRSPSLGGLNFAVGSKNKEKPNTPSKQEPNSPSLEGLNFALGPGAKQLKASLIKVLNTSNESQTDKKRLSRLVEEGSETSNKARMIEDSISNFENHQSLKNKYKPSFSERVRSRSSISEKIFRNKFSKPSVVGMEDLSQSLLDQEKEENLDMVEFLEEKEKYFEGGTSREYVFLCLRNLGLWRVLGVFLFSLLHQGVLLGGYYLLSLNLGLFEELKEKRGQYIVLAGTILYCLTVIFAITLVWRSGKALSKKTFAKMVWALLHCDVSSFLNRIPVSIIHNRFKEDLSKIDTNLRYSLENTMMIGSEILIIMAIYAYFYSYFFLLPVIMISVLLFCLKGKVNSAYTQLENHKISLNLPTRTTMKDLIFGIQQVRIFQLEDFYFQKLEKYFEHSVELRLLEKGLESWYELRIHLYVNCFLLMPIIAFHVFTRISSYQISEVAMAIFFAVAFSDKLSRLWFLVGDFKSIATTFYNLSLFDFIPREKRLDPYVYNLEEVDGTDCALRRMKKAQNLQKEKAQDLGRGLLEFRNVFVRYPLSSSLALRSLSFILKPGEKVAMVGLKGSGKSSVLRAIWGAVDLADGDILFSTHHLLDLKRQNIRQSLGVISEESLIMGASLRENIGLQKETSPQEEAKMIEILNSLGFDNPDYANKGLDGVVSAGSAKTTHCCSLLIALARVIYQKKKIILIDQLSQHLSPEVVSTLLNSFKDSLASSTVLIVACSRDVIAACDRLLVLEEGQIAAMGPCSEFLAERNSLVDRIFQANTRVGPSPESSLVKEPSSERNT